MRPNKRGMIAGKRVIIWRPASLVALAALALAIAFGGAPDSRPASAGAQTGTPASASESHDGRSQVLVMRVYFRDNAERDRLATELGADEVDTRGGYLTLWSGEAMYNRLLKRGLRVEIDHETTRQANNPILFGGGSGDTFAGGYKTVEEMEAFLDQKVAAYPLLAEKIDIGDSWCKTHPGACLVPTPYNGNDLWVLHITNRAIPGPKPVYWFDTGIHSREIATPEMAMRFINWLLDNYNTDADAHWLVDWHDIWVMPMFNPDGHHVVEQGDSQPFTQRKNLDNDDGCVVYPPSDVAQLGVDLNRNFPFLWGCCNGSSTISCDLTYRGPSAGSEEETQAMLAKVSTLVPDQRGPNNSDPAPITTTGIMQSMHSYANLNLYAWGWTTAPSPNEADLANIGAHMSAPDAGGNGYDSCAPPRCLYAVDGDSVDWGYGELGMASFTTELEGGTFFPAYSQVEQIWNNNKGMLTHMAKIARTPYLLTRGPDANNVTVVPTTVTVGTDAYLSGIINYAWEGNRYLQNVAAAEYYVDTPPWAGGVAIAMSAYDGAFNSPTEEVEAIVSTGALSAGRHIIFVRGRGTNSYQGHLSWGPVSAVFLDVVQPFGTATPTFTGTPPTATGTRTPRPTQTPVPPTATSTPLGCGATQPFVEGFEGGSLNSFTTSNGIPGATDLWAVVTSTVHSGAFAAHAADVAEQSDQHLTMLNPVAIPASASQAELHFDHTYKFEAPDWDGGVLEYSIDGGTIWTDAGSNVTSGGYTGVITVTAGNPLSGRAAWVGEIPGYPGYSHVTVDLASLRGLSVKFRFRLGSDLAAGAPGWWIDDLFILIVQPCTTSTPTATGTPPTSTPTQTPGGNALTGHLTWQGRPPQPHPLQALPISLTLKSDLTERNYLPQSTDASGFFTVTTEGLPPGTYNWRVKGPKYLANGGTVIVAPGAVQQEMGLMRAGDCNNDNVVNAIDFNVVRAAFGLSTGQAGYDDRADFTGDGVVSAQDFNLLRGNFGTGGAPPVRP